MPSPRLTHPIRPKDHAALVTVEDACVYMAALPASIAMQQTWQHAASLALGLSTTPSKVEIEEFGRQVELALFATYRYDLDGS
jgi:hypothetical protein